MARPISMLVEPSIGCKITSYVKDGDPVVTPVFIGDKVTDFKYVDKNEAKTINGKVSDINVTWKSASSSTNNDSTLNKDAVVSSITIDSSRIQNSVITTVKSKDVLEYGTEDECEKVTVTPYITVDFTVTLSDNSKSEGTIKLGTKFEELVTLEPKGTEATTSGEVTAFIYAYNTKTVDRSKDMEIVGFIVTDETGDTKRVSWIKVKSFSILREDEDGE